MTQYTSPHDEPWFSDPDQPWGGARKRVERDPDVERDRRMDDALTETPSTPEKAANKLQVNMTPSRYISEIEREWREQNGVA